MDIQFINTEELGIEIDGFQQYIERLKKHVPKTEGILNVIFVNDEYIQALNKQYRDKDKPTDVLSFSYIEEGEASELIGEIYISIPTAKGQMGDFGNDLQHELYRLFVHGFLHIFGHDHEDDTDYEVMKKVEDEVLRD